MPFIAGAREPATDPVSELLAKFARPLPHRFVANDITPALTIYTNSRLPSNHMQEHVKVLGTSWSIEPCACPSLHLLPLCCPAPLTPCLAARDGSSSPSGTAFERWCFATATRSYYRAATRSP